MTAPKKKPAARKPAAKKPAEKPAAKKTDPEVPTASDPLDNVPAEPQGNEGQPQGNEGQPPADPPTEPKKKSLPGYLSKRVLTDTDRKNLIEDFNKSFDAEFPSKLKSPATLKNMQRRLLNQVYHK